MILGCIEKIAFSALNLKVLLEPGQREVARWKMLQLLEFVTGIDKEEVVGENRSAHYHAMDMSDRSEARGRPGRDLFLQRDLAALDARRVLIGQLEVAHRDQQIGGYRVLRHVP